MADGIVGWRTQYTTETLQWAIDSALDVDPGDVLSSATSTLTDLLTGASYPAGLSGSASVSGTTLLQTVTALQAGHNYRLVITGGLQGGKARAVGVYLACPF